MKCATHNSEATGICAYCGRAGQRDLFFSVRRIVTGGGGWRAFLSAVAVSDLVHGGLP
ncbi:MAG TPA: hypothetical protein VIK35_05640 [Verrucomicrobiae bacterium]